MGEIDEWIAPDGGIHQDAGRVLTWPAAGTSPLSVSLYGDFLVEELRAIVAYVDAMTPKEA